MVNTLKLDPFTRSLWGEFDAYAIAQLEALAYDPCFKPKFYVAPDLASNNLNAAIPGVPPQGYVEYGLEITPGALIIGSFLPNTIPQNFAAVLGASINPVPQTDPQGFLVQMTDVSLNHKLFDQPIPSWFLSNAKGDMPNLWDTPYPVVGSGLFRMEFWNTAVGLEITSGTSITPVARIIQLVLCVLEPCDPQ